MKFWLGLWLALSKTEQSVLCIGLYFYLMNWFLYVGFIMRMQLGSNESLKDA